MHNEHTIKRIIEFAGRIEGIDMQVFTEGLSIMHLHRQLEQTFENDLFAGLGLTVRQLELMESLFHNSEGMSTPAELAEEVGLTRSAMTGALDSLEKRGYTVRGPHPNDRRMTVISLTSAGQEFISHELVSRYRGMGRIMGTLSSDERMNLLKTYRKVLDVITREPRKSRTQP